ncbi:MAG TPA: aldo/keto reductase [Candidatus Avipropionibacterium avicola]|uniref:Aldo/keto reductase n=1 Tax=Candidatus Avipropionibacterium avicola TaxID=2840701 RepID=A0A9D1GYM5_9ACTN|nr:aldo/keto reductase [Candidatus Avipropionibacterium avicola]
MTFAKPALALADGHAIPLLGLGTWQIPDDQAETAVGLALEYGYRHLDTATRYRNEAGVGRGLAAASVPRDEVFVTTKFPPDKPGQERRLLEQSLTALGLDRIDLWLIHAPGGDEREDPLIDTWRQFIAAQQEGLVTSIGVSNYTLDQLDVLERETGVMPVLNQILWSPTDHDPRIAAGHRDRGVVLEGFSALRRTNLDDPVLSRIAAAHGISTAQVVIAWHAAHDYVVIPKSVHAERIAANADAVRVVLTEDEVAAIDALREA